MSVLRIAQIAIVVLVASCGDALSVPETLLSNYRLVKYEGQPLPAIAGTEIIVSVNRQSIRCTRSITAQELSFSPTRSGVSQVTSTSVVCDSSEYDHQVTDTLRGSAYQDGNEVTLRLARLGLSEFIARGKLSGTRLHIYMHESLADPKGFSPQDRSFEP